MRGKVSGCFFVEYLFRITPAYAGKSPQVHFKFELKRGSPPPMRGKA